MAYLRSLQTGEICYLLAHHSFGRRKNVVDTFIDNPGISKIHCIIEWDNAHWIVRDVSRNGTWLDENKLLTANNYELKVGQIIYLALPGTSGWLVEDLDGPCDLLLPMNSQTKPVKLSKYQLLPDDNSPLLALYFSPDSGKWLVEYVQESVLGFENTGIKYLEHGDNLSCKDFEWQFFLSGELKPTVNLVVQPLLLNQFEFVFELSLDEEHACLKLQYENNCIDLFERSYHYTLLHLARCRAHDRENGYDEKSQGWVYNLDLAKQLGIDVSHLNIQIFRARKQFAERLSEVIGLESLVERRKGSMRFGCSQFKIFKGDHLEVEMQDSVIAE